MVALFGYAKQEHVSQESAFLLAAGVITGMTFVTLCIVTNNGGRKKQGSLLNKMLNQSDVSQDINASKEYKLQETPSNQENLLSDSQTKITPD